MKEPSLAIVGLMLFTGFFAADNTFPLTIGNVWKYNLITVGAADTVVLCETTFVTMKITRDTVLNDGTPVRERFIIDVLKKDTSRYYEYYVAKDDYILMYSQLEDLEADTLMKFPLAPGAAWNSNDEEQSFVEGQQVVRVPGGVFEDCWKIGTVKNEDTTYFYYAPGIGLVKLYYRLFGGQDSMVLRCELKSTNLK